MTQISEYLKQIRTYCDISLEFDTTNKRYKFNQVFTDEVNCKEFEFKIQKFQTSFSNILETISKPEVFIQDVLNIIVKFPYWYDSKEIYKLSSFDKLDKIMVGSKHNIKTKVKYSLHDIQI